MTKRLALISCVVAVALLALLGCATTGRPKAAKFVLRVNCAASEPYTDKAGNLWLADQDMASDREWGSVGGMTVDRQGNTWLPDQIFERGGYGYIGDSLLRRPRQVLDDVDIQQTQNDEIYRTGRTQLTHYLISVPNGMYDVMLHFAHLVEGRLWNPTIDVKIEEKAVLQRLSADSLKRLHGASRRFKRIVVADGVLDIGLTQSDLALCGVEIFRR